MGGRPDVGSIPASVRLPKVSVVIPVHNAEEWIGDSLRSVAAQTYPVDLLEILVVDDGSTDGSAEIVESFLGSGPHRGELIRTTKGGPSRARNLGWRQSRGEWIQFLDADDLLHPDKLAVQAPAAAALSETVAVIHSDWQVLQRSEQKWLLQPARSPRVDDDPICELLKDEGFVHTGSALFRRTCLEQVEGFDERHWLIEDVDLMLRLAMAGFEFHRIEVDHPLFFYRRDLPGSLSQQGGYAFLEGCVRNAELVESYCRDNGVLTLAREQAIASVYYLAARNFVELDRDRFEHLSLKLESLSPGFLPSAPAYLRWLSRLMGYRNAERFCLPVRRAFRKLRTAKLTGR